MVAWAYDDLSGPCGMLEVERAYWADLTAAAATVRDATSPTKKGSMTMVTDTTTTWVDHDDGADAGRRAYDDARLVADDIASRGVIDGDDPTGDLGVDDRAPFPARYPGSCGRCDGPIEPGDPIAPEPDSDGGWVCADCHEEAAS